MVQYFVDTFSEISSSGNVNGILNLDSCFTHVFELRVSFRNPNSIRQMQIIVLDHETSFALCEHSRRTSEDSAGLNSITHLANQRKTAKQQSRRQ